MLTASLLQVQEGALKHGMLHQAVQVLTQHLLTTLRIVCAATTNNLLSTQL
jgi:hypothetical protein